MGVKMMILWEVFLKVTLQSQTAFPLFARMHILTFLFFPLINKNTYRSLLMKVLFDN
jgi:hypothetical protein